MKNKFHLIMAFVAAFACSAPIALTAAISKKSPSPAASPSVSPSPKTKNSPSPKATASPSPHPTVSRSLPFRGMISAVDQKAKTFTIAGKEKSRVFKVTDKTVLSKAGAAATMKDVVANEEVRGSYWKLPDGTLEAKTVKLGPKTDAEKAADEKRKKKSSKSEASPEASPSASPSASPKS